MRNETVEEFIARGGKVSKITKVLGEKSTVSANYRGGHGKTRMGKNGSGKYKKSESYVCLSGSSYGRPWINNPHNQ